MIDLTPGLKHGTTFFSHVSLTNIKILAKLAVCRMFVTHEPAGVLTIYANHPDGNFRHKYEMI